MFPQNLIDVGTERAVLGTIVKNGKDSLIDVMDIVTENDFSLPVNRAIFACVKSLAEETTCQAFDTESIKGKAKILGLNTYFETTASSQYLELISESTFNIDRLRYFALQIKKLSIARTMHLNAKDVTQYLEKIDGSETLADIISHSEQKFTDYVNNIDLGEKICKLYDGMSSMIDELLSKEIVSEVGVSTGFPLWDMAIGGGLRKGTVNLTGARPKTGKTFHAFNVARNIAKTGVPTLFLDTEMTLKDQQSRLLCMDSGCPIYFYETGQFKDDKNLVSSVKESASRIKSWPLYHISIAGNSPEEVTNIIRRWLVKYVGFNEQGKANDCVVVYDYLKLTGTEDMAINTPEYILLGLMITRLHNFAVQYMIPIKAFVQLNREGIDTENGGVIAGSDRLLWLCTNFSILKNKNETDKDFGCGSEFGNKKLLVCETRHGPGLDDSDYINIFAKTRPGVPVSEGTGLFREGALFSSIKKLSSGDLGEIRSGDNSSY